MKTKKNKTVHAQVYASSFSTPTERVSDGSKKKKQTSKGMKMSKKAKEYC